MGMNPAAINFPDDIDTGKVIQAIQARKRVLLQEDNSSPIEYKVKPVFIENCSRKIDFLLYLEFKTKRLRESSFNPTRSFVSIEDVIINPCELRNADKYDKPSEWPLDINFILDKMKHSPPDSSYFEELKPSRRHWLVTDFVLAIEVAKALPIYEQIETKDRLLLLEFVGLINAILLQTYYSYEQNSDTIKAPDGFMPIKTGPKDRP
uniref:Uncharacterized protein n=1 Tax=Acrobeloides nanus TaxID=290746 RepID=A0A914DBA6_9BILA